MAATTPLQLLLFRHSDEAATAPYEEAIVRAFQGGKEPRPYLATGDDLGVELRVFEDAPNLAVAGTIDAACHTQTVVLAGPRLLAAGPALWNWLGDAWTHTRQAKGRHGMFVVPLEESSVAEILAKNPALASLQMAPASTLGEAAIRPALLSLRILHLCRVLLAGGLAEFAGAARPGYLRLFISHAKSDGLPLALALKHQIRQLKWLEDFYDADDLAPGCDWQLELEKGVGSSLIVMLRTDIYDTRYWCQQEVYWADEYATPAVMVDARTTVNLPSSALPFERVPAVRIPDGNLLRVLFLAIREGLRFLHFKRRVEEMRASGALPQPLELRVFSIPPSMAALLRACRAMAGAPADTARMILYPDPVLRTGLYEAAQALVAQYAPGARLVTPSTLAVETGGAR